MGDIDPMKSTHFTYDAAEKKCPGCGERLRLSMGYLFCRREHGTFFPFPSRLTLRLTLNRRTRELPVATRTAKTGRFTIAGEEGYWRIPSHAHKQLLHDGPEKGSVIALLLRYHSKIPTVVTFMPRKVRNVRQG